MLGVPSFPTIDFILPHTQVRIARMPPRHSENQIPLEYLPRGSDQVRSASLQSAGWKQRHIQLSRKAHRGVAIAVAAVVMLILGVIVAGIVVFVNSKSTGGDRSGAQATSAREDVTTLTLSADSLKIQTTTSTLFSTASLYTLITTTSISSQTTTSTETLTPPSSVTRTTHITSTKVEQSTTTSSPAKDRTVIASASTATAVSTLSWTTTTLLTEDPEGILTRTRPLIVVVYTTSTRNIVSGVTSSYTIHPGSTLITASTIIVLETWEGVRGGRTSQAPPVSDTWTTSTLLIPPFVVSSTTLFTVSVPPKRQIYTEHLMASKPSATPYGLSPERVQSNGSTASQHLVQISEDLTPSSGDVQGPSSTAVGKPQAGNSSGMHARGLTEIWTTQTQTVYSTLVKTHRSSLTKIVTITGSPSSTRTAMDELPTSTQTVGDIDENCPADRHSQRISMDHCALVLVNGADNSYANQKCDVFCQIALSGACDFCWRGMSDAFEAEWADLYPPGVAEQQSHCCGKCKCAKCWKGEHVLEGNGLRNATQVAKEGTCV